MKIKWSLTPGCGNRQAHLLAYARLDDVEIRRPAFRPANAIRAGNSGAAQQATLSAHRRRFDGFGCRCSRHSECAPANIREKTFSTPVGGRQILTLTDGSRIELNTDTVLRVALGKDHRTVWLDKGEAYFQVKHDAARPFVIYTNGRRITDLGTKFLVRADQGRLEVALLEGRVRLDAATDQPQAMTVLTAGDDAVAVGNTTSVPRNPFATFWPNSDGSTA